MALRVILGLLIAASLSGCFGSSESGSNATVAGVTVQGVVVGSTQPATSASLVLAGVPAASVVVGGNYSFRPTVTSVGAVTFSIQGLPSWASFDVSSGTLSGTPSAGDAGYTADITIIATEGEITGSIGPFVIQVVPIAQPPATSAPVISGAPPTSVTSGQTYSFQPVASDAAGKPLTFTITNCPVWATFSTATGKLAGTPTGIQAGTYPSITIRVTNGTSSATLPAFSIVVSVPPPPVTATTGSATLTWVPPTQNVDGTPLKDLEGYTVYYGASPTAMKQTLQITDPTVVKTVISGLTSGTWYFEAMAYNSANVESAASVVVSKTID